MTYALINNEEQHQYEFQIDTYFARIVYILNLSNSELIHKKFTTE